MQKSIMFVLVHKTVTIVNVYAGKYEEGDINVHMR